VGLLGIGLNGFALHGWYRVLDRVFGKQLDSWRVVLSKVVADQAVYAPFACASFLVWASVLQVTGRNALPPGPPLVSGGGVARGAERT
jgi:hypothetical protein